MSAFFDWDTEPVKQAILAGLAKQKVSVDPSDYEEGLDDWGDEVKISFPKYYGLEYFTDRWDVNLWDNEGVFTVTAYPIYDGEPDYSSWITCLELPFISVDPNQQADEDQYQEER
jgi:hypothetical protein